MAASNDSGIGTCKADEEGSCQKHHSVGLSREESSIVLRALAAAAAGTTGAVVTTVIFHPVALIRDRLAAAARNDGFAYSGMVDGLVSVVRSEGLLGLYAGIGPTVARVLLSDFLTIFLGDVLIGSCRGSRRLAGDAMVLPLRIVADLIRTPIVMPLDVISTRVTTSRVRLTFRDAARTLWREGGARAFFSGLRVSMVLSVNPAFTYTSFEWFRSLLHFMLRQRDGDVLSVSQAFVLGAAAKMLTLTLVYPLIRGKFLLQARDTGGVGLFRVLHEVALHDGVRGLYQGFGAQLSRSLPSAALMLAVKEWSERWWRLLLLRRP
eukprot:gnl/TRDRNA2_/TRDRNA2_83089_c0_seq1.p1 gnl/TRDRNA2_/TRDRNA2_83089_c0~~gnl/TRDRNA2_/TRDRNA2_83089_c0_seq1.p1  ORF type:complete len:322 (-),score=44.35 gnl/TRDRNA2_/TRDRNA2_83089_c0_seq1:65-1030(-)